MPQLRSILACCLAALGLTSAAPAAATTLTGLAVSNASTSAFDDSGPIGSLAQSDAAVGASGPTGFAVRYGAVLGADTGGAGGGSFTETLAGSFTIEFEVSEAAGSVWAVGLDVVRSGALTIVSDGSGWAEVTLGALSVSHVGAGTWLGGLDLAAVGTLDNAVAPASSPDQAFLQTSSVLLSGLGTGAPELVTLVFSFTASVRTLDVAGGFVQGDEAALRMGRDGALLSFTADDYPGPGGRSFVADGIFVTATVPEPGAEILLALGLIGLGWAERQRRR